MGKKLSDDTHGMKSLHLFSLLLFGGRNYSLGELAQKLSCSKPTVLRAIREIELSGLVYIETWIGEDRKRYYNMSAPRIKPRTSLTEEHIQSLVLCRDMVRHLLPDSIRRTIDQGIAHSTVLLKNFEERKASDRKLATARPKGEIDYSNYSEIITALQKAIRENLVCETGYIKPRASEARVHHFAPFRFVSHSDSLHVQGWRLSREGVPPEVCLMNLAVHRISGVTLTDQTYQGNPPTDDADAKLTFGLIEGEPFRVKISFTADAACYIQERIWSHDQTLVPKDDGGVILDFCSTSWPEVVSWVLSFGREAMVLEPLDLREEIKKQAHIVWGYY